ncbi:MAG: hypothetical protein ACTSX9_05560 [Candidatus Njordarchaeales archaeon]
MLSFIILSGLSRCVFTPFLGVYLDKIGIYLTAFFLGFWYTIIQAFLIIAFHFFVINDPIALLRLPPYVIFAIIVGGLTDTMIGRRVLRGIIEFSWFITLTLIGLTFSLDFPGLTGRVLFLIFLLLGVLFSVPYTIKVQKLARIVRSRYSMVMLYLLTPIVYMLLEFDSYALIMFNFLEPNIIPYTDIPRATITYGGDALLSLLVPLVIILGYTRGAPACPLVRISRRNIAPFIVFLLVLLGAFIPAYNFYESRENSFSTDSSKEYFSLGINHC